MFTNSPLVVYTLLSPNFNPRPGKISKITIHHMAGNLSIERCAELFQNPARDASANYVVGSDGRIGLVVEEKNRAWTSSSRENDNVAVTIEVANNSGKPNWTVSDDAYEATINLCVDICKRNDIQALVFNNTKNGTLTMHCMFAATECPGPYLKGKFPEICAEINRRLANGGVVTPSNTPSQIDNPKTDKNRVIKSSSGIVKYTHNNLDYGYVFDPIYYVNSDPELRKLYGLSSIKLFDHFCKVGIRNHHQANSFFNVEAYMKKNPDLQKAFGIPNDEDWRWIKYYEHFIIYGRNENRETL
jgi:hypothetical protein